MTAKFTAALNVIGTPWHVTLAFCDAKRGKKTRTTSAVEWGAVTDVVYWKRNNVTVALIDSPLITDRHKYWTENGYGYSGFEYKPHATLSRGDTTVLNASLIGSTVLLGDEYVRLY